MFINSSTAFAHNAAASLLEVIMVVRIPKDAKQRKAALTGWELRKTVAEALKAEDEFRNHQASAAKARVYTLYGEVNEENIREALSELGVWSREYPGKPLTIILNSVGGDISDGRAFYDYVLHLRSIGHHITIVALGQASSMAAVMLQAADVRVMGPNAWLLIHETSTTLEGTVSSLREQLLQLEREDEQTTRILASRSSMSVADINVAMAKKDWWLDASEAIRLGFADEMLQPKHMPAKRRAAPRKGVEEGEE